jgi:hypothetical protein
MILIAKMVAWTYSDYNSEKEEAVAITPGNCNTIL